MSGGSAPGGFYRSPWRGSFGAGRKSSPGVAQKFVRKWLLKARIWMKIYVSGTSFLKGACFEGLKPAMPGSGTIFQPKPSLERPFSPKFLSCILNRK